MVPGFLKNHQVVLTHPEEVQVKQELESAVIPVEVKSLNQAAEVRAVLHKEGKDHIKEAHHQDVKAAVHHQVILHHQIPVAAAVVPAVQALAVPAQVDQVPAVPVRALEIAAEGADK